MAKKGLLISILFLLNVVLFGQVNSSNTYKFLNLPTSARCAAMGGSFISSNASDLNLVADNPAVLDSTMDNLATLTYINYITNVNMGYLAYSRHFDKVGTFSAGMQFLGYGEFIRADESGNQIGTFTAGDYALDISYGLPIDSMFSIGGSMKIIYSSYDYLNSFGLAFDIGAKYISKNKLFTAGAVINNIGWELKPYFQGQGQNLPFNLQIAGSLKLAKAPLRFTILANNLQAWDLTGSQAVDGLPTIGPDGNSIASEPSNTFTANNIFRHFVFGAEIIPSENFFIQIAYNYLRHAELAIQGRNSLNGLSMGFGFRMKRLKFSYALASYASKGTSHHLTLSTDLKSFKRNGSN